MSPGWTVVMPVKPLSRAKSRLRGAAPGVPHDDLVLAMATDTLTAVLACPAVENVIVVTNDARVRATAVGLTAICEPDAPDAGLNPAIVHGSKRVGRRVPVAALAADLPALHPTELFAALSAATAYERAFVTDVGQTGTALLTARRRSKLDPRFGAGSAGAHAATGAVRMPGPWHTLHRDVDTPMDLASATALGLGAHTAALLHAHSPVHGG